MSLGAKKLVGVGADQRVGIRFFGPKYSVFKVGFVVGRFVWRSWICEKKQKLE